MDVCAGSCRSVAPRGGRWRPEGMMVSSGWFAEIIREVKV